jgi:1,4-dihydroxy-2-naphthoate octaprenyltransferase
MSQIPADARRAPGARSCGGLYAAAVPSLPPSPHPAPSPAFARARAFVRLGRPLFLGGGFVLYGLGAALAAYAGAPIDRRRYLWGQLAVTVTQLMTHYANDYFDLPADRANTTPTRWSGGSRVLAEGALPPWVALAAALTLGALALALTALFADGPLAARLAGRPFPPLAAPLLLLMILLAWAYSAPPLRLHARGLGELTTALVVPLLTPLLGFVLQAGAARRLPLLAALPPCAMQFTMLLAIEFPDQAGDAAVGKRTLVVRLGGAWAARLYVAVIAASYLALPLLVTHGLPPRIAIFAAATAPLAAWQVTRVAGGAWRDRRRWESLAFWAVALLMAVAGAELLAAVTA